MESHDGGGERLAPVIPLFGNEQAPHLEADGVTRHPAFAAAEGRAGAEQRVRLRALERAHDHSDDPGLHRVRDERGARAEELLVRRLRAKQLSIAEAQSILRGHDVDSERVDAIIDEFCHRGYLDDRTLASLLARSAVERGGHGRIAISRMLSQRGIPRDIVDEALVELPDDDADRALEFARSRARSMAGLEPDTALRRLLGQLARRGYDGSVAMNAARTALREAGIRRGATADGVRFVDAD